MKPTANFLRSFNRPATQLYRAYDHLIAARLGMTLMVPVAASEGKLEPLVDQCPVPWIEATAILDVDYEVAQPLSLPLLVKHAGRLNPKAGNAIADFARDLLQAFVGQNGIYFYDQAWRHAQIRTSTGVEPCRVFIGATGIRLAFVPDFLEGVL
jgi:hypothetical protein